MIRVPAALNLARQILEPFEAEDVAMELAATLILLAVEQDELQQEVERKESVVMLLDPRNAK